MTTAEQRVEGQPAYVIHTRPYRDTSALVDLFSERFGRVRVVARGVRKPRSRLREALQLFVPLQVAWQGRGELKTLVSVEAQAISPFFQGRALWCGLYLNELVMRLLPLHDGCPRLFAYYRLALSGLADPDTLEAVLRLFEQRLLEELGVGVAWDRDAHGDPLDAAGCYRLEPDQGFLPAAAGQRGSYAGEQLLAIAEQDYRDPRTRRAAKWLMRQALAPHLGDRPLNSRALFGGRGEGAEEEA